MLTVLIVVAVSIWLILNPPQIYPGGVVSTILYYAMAACTMVLFLAVLVALVVLIL